MVPRARSSIRDVAWGPLPAALTSAWGAGRDSVPQPCRAEVQCLQMASDRVNLPNTIEEVRRKPIVLTRSV